MSNDNNQVRILVAGVRPTVAEVRDGETLADLAKRLTTGDLPLDRIESFYVNGTPVSDPNAYVVQPGDSIQAARKHVGG